MNTRNYDLDNLIGETLGFEKQMSIGKMVWFKVEFIEVGPKEYQKHSTNVQDEVDKLKSIIEAHTEQRVCDARIKENRNIKHQAMSADDNLQLILCIDQRIANLKELKAQLKKSTKGGSDAS